MNNIQKRIQFFKNICLLITQLSNEGISVIPFSFYRSPEEQVVLFQQGKSKVRFSKHQQWLAIDLVIVKDGKPVWNYIKEYDRIGEIAESLGLKWGGRWSNPKDIYHIEYM